MATAQGMAKLKKNKDIRKMKVEKRALRKQKIKKKRYSLIRWICTKKESDFHL